MKARQCFLKVNRHLIKCDCIINKNQNLFYIVNNTCMYVSLMFPKSSCINFNNSQYQY